jgi:hypothetical protein
MFRSFFCPAGQLTEDGIAMKKVSQLMLGSATVALVCMGAHLAVAQVPPPDSGFGMLMGQMQMGEGIAGQVMPGDTNRHEIRVDRASQVSFLCMWGEGDIDLAFVDPNGVRYDSVSTAGSESVYLLSGEMFEGINMETCAFVKNPATGKWTVEVMADDAPPEGIGYMVSLVLEGAETNLTVLTDKDYYSVGDTIVVTAVIEEGSSGGTVDVSAIFMAQDFSQDTVDLFDDGTHGDPTPSDGRYTGDYAGADRRGYYTISVQATRGGPGGFTRIAGWGASVASSRSRFSGTYRDEGIDTDGDGQFDALTFDVGVEIDKPGVYSVGGQIDDAAGQFVGSDQVDTALSSGAHFVRLSFSGEHIYEKRGSGPFHLNRLSLCEADESQSEMPMILQFVESAAVSRSYSAWDFQGSGIFVAGNATNRGLDVDGNGLYDSLIVTIEVDIRESDYYHWQGNLLGTDMQGTLAIGEGFLEAGRRIVALAFEGAEIRQSGGDGPYEVSAPAMYGNKGANTLGGNFRTKAYRAEQFEK